MVIYIYKTSLWCRRWPIGDMLKTNLGSDKSRPIRKQVATCFFHVEWSAMSHHKVRGTLGVGGGEWLVILLNVRYTNEQIRLNCLASFIFDKAQTSFNMFMREVDRCDESYNGVGYLIIVVNHHIQKGMGDMGLLTCQMPAWTNIDNAITSIFQKYQRLFKFSLQSSLTEYQI